MAQCTCGREFSIVKPHCTKCGSTYTYATPSRDRDVKDSEGVIYVNRYFVCRKCGEGFRGSDTCEAPQISQSTAARVTRQNPNIALDSDTLKGAIPVYKQRFTESGKLPPEDAIKTFNGIGIDLLAEIGAKDE